MLHKEHFAERSFVNDLFDYKVLETNLLLLVAFAF